MLDVLEYFMHLQATTKNKKLNIQRNYAIAQGMEQLRALMDGEKYDYAGMLLAYNQIDQALQASPEVVDETTRTRLIQIRQLLSAREHLQHNRADQALANLSTSYTDPKLLK